MFSINNKPANQKLLNLIKNKHLKLSKLKQIY